MLTVSECQKRAKQCAERALIVSGAADRLHWHQLAAEWLALSRVPFQMWKGDHDGDEHQGAEAHLAANQMISRREHTG
jgi:hypothetical protein